MNIPKVLGAAFYRTTQVAAFEFCFSIKRSFKKESRDTALELISLFNVQIQEPTRSTMVRAFVFLANIPKFYYYKIFETRSRPKCLF